MAISVRLEIYITDILYISLLRCSPFPFQSLHNQFSQYLFNFHPEVDFSRLLCLVVCFFAISFTSRFSSPTYLCLCLLAINCMHFYRWLFVYLFVCFRTVAGTFDKVALSQMFFLHSTEAWKEKIKVDEQDKSAQEKNWFWKKTVHSTQNQGGVEPERHFLNLNFSQKSITTYWRRLRGGLSWFILGSYLISILVPASPIWSLDLGKDGLEQAGQARQIPKPGLFKFFAFFSKAAGGKRWVGGASRKP